MSGVSADRTETVRRHLGALYDDATVESVLPRVLELAERYRDTLAARDVAPNSQRTAFLITYGSSFTRDGEAPLRTLAYVLDEFGTEISDVHLLPMYPWTSDDGFAVVDHRRIDPALGTWDDVTAVGEGRGLMFDFVANHISSESEWFVRWLAGDARYADYFFEPGPEFDTSAVVRPRTTPLTHDYERPDGTFATAWTTFGPDQVDVHVGNPEVLLDLTDVLLEYLAAGASTVRLDAIGFLWKESGTTCLHLPGTHAVIKLWRVLIDDLMPRARLLTETNVPHRDNVSYFGNGHDEAHMVYQFALPPLVLHSFVAGDSSALTAWAAGLEPLPAGSTWFNFLASHDGVGMRPAKGLLAEADVEALVARVQAHGGLASFAGEPGGGRSVYELNTSYLDALAEPERVGDTAHEVGRALAAHAIMFAMAGVPAIYYHSLFGSHHDTAAVERTGIPRRINRATLDADELRDQLDSDPRRRGVYEGLAELLRRRGDFPAFAPDAPQQVLELGPEVFAVRRGEGADTVTVVVNVSGAAVTLEGVAGRDVLSGALTDALSLEADGFAWLVPS
ncbi:alpha-amylase family glycosyl hydrolase [uncultured Schumannella sp.]|uniref:alpha-amylase family glycosyl hydrolase n=1 Tax=uncultured Schumannella sp. TaxID=1195956 RepID=UPI0025F80FA0|nr:alpha-amylase family glycosyl hydrolase [uncultured Schumannella sp.]